MTPKPFAPRPVCCTFGSTLQPGRHFSTLFSSSLASNAASNLHTEISDEVCIKVNIMFAGDCQRSGLSMTQSWVKSVGCSHMHMATAPPYGLQKVATNWPAFI